MKTTKLSRIALLWIAVVTIFVTNTACHLNPFRAEETPTPIPAPKPVEDLYSDLRNEKDSNPTRSEAIVAGSPFMDFTGKITNIEDNKVQFHLEDDKVQLNTEDPWPFWDNYVECKFADKRSIISLNKGQMVTLRGNLDKVSRVVIFENCRILSQAP